jgi:arylsulfatase A
LFPTLLAMTGLQSPPNHRPDGVSIVPLLRQQTGFLRDAIFWHYPHYQLYQQGGTVPYSAIRFGDDKLIEFLDGRPSELYNLRNDIGEKTNVAAAQPEKVRTLRERLAAWRREIGAQIPTPNPAYDASKPEHEPNAKQLKRDQKG